MTTAERQRLSRRAASRGAADAKRAARLPQRVLTPPKPIRGFRESTLRSLRLDGTTLDLGLRDAHTDIEVALSIAGASTVTIPTLDPERAVATSGILDAERVGLMSQLVTLEMDGLRFVLVRVEKNLPSYNLVFESEAVRVLRLFTERRKAYRDKTSRARFLWGLVREDAQRARRKIGFYSPELLDTQPIAGGDKPDTPVARSVRGDEAQPDRKPGFSPGARVTVKGQAASRGQLEVIAGCLAQAVADGASRGVQIAVVACITQESGAGALAGVMTGNDDVGIFQQGRNWISEAGSQQPGPSTHAFLVTGPSSWKKVHGSLQTVPGGYEAAIKAVQISVGGYQPWVAEAAQAVAAYNGAAGNISSPRTSSTFEVEKRYQFTRGDGAKRENTWQAGLRHAELVGWRWFEVGGTIVYASDEELIRQRPAMSLWEGADGLVSMPWTVDAGRPVDECSLTVHAALWGAQPGQVVELLDEGPATGRWLVESVTGSRYSPEAEVELVRPARKKPEPAPETRTVTVPGTPGATTQGGASGASGASGSLRQRIVEIAKDTMTSNSGFSRYSLTGALTDDLTPATERTDCSQWTRAVYLKAGAGDPGTNTWNQIERGKRTNNPKPGDLLFPSSLGHVELYIGNNVTIGHGSPPIDYWSVSGVKAYFGDVFFVTFDFLD